MAITNNPNALGAQPVAGRTAAPGAVSQRRGGWMLRRRIRAHRGAVVTISGIWIAFLVIVTLTIQWWPIPTYALAIGPSNVGPHWGAEFLGTDAAGRSIISRLLYGARTSMVISIVAAALSFLIGSLIGIMAAFFGKSVKTVGEVIANTILSIPPLVLLLGIVLALGSSVTTIMIACGLVFIPQYLRLTRAEASRQLAREYITAARLLGASSKRIMIRELLPNTVPSLISFTVLVLPAVMVIEGGLSFLGYGVQSPTPSWGNMIALGDQYLSSQPWESIMPCIFLGFTIFAMITMGDYLRARLASRGPVET